MRSRTAPRRREEGRESDGSGMMDRKKGKTRRGTPCRDSVCTVRAGLSGGSGARTRRRLGPKWFRTSRSTGGGSASKSRGTQRWSLRLLCLLCIASVGVSSPPSRTPLEPSSIALSWARESGGSCPSLARLVPSLFLSSSTSLSPKVKSRSECSSASLQGNARVDTLTPASFTCLTAQDVRRRPQPGCSPQLPLITSSPQLPPTGERSGRRSVLAA